MGNVNSGYQFISFMAAVKGMSAPPVPHNASAPDFIKEWVSWGAGLRASQNLILGGKVRALLMGRYNVSYGDIQALAEPVLRHRILLNFHAEAEKVGVEEIIQRLVETVPVPAGE